MGDVGYGTLYLDGQHTRSHRAAWTLSHGETVPRGQVVMHVCDNRRCCNPFHLSLGTQRENLEDMRVKGRRAHGEAHVHAQINTEIVLAVRRARRAGETQRSIAARFGLRFQHVHKIVHGTLWAHVQEPDT